MALSTQFKNPVMGVLKLIDGAGTTLVVPYDKGDLAVSGLHKVLNEYVLIQTRGKHRGVVYGNRQYPEVSFSAFITEFTNVTAGNVLDFVLKRGGYAANTSTVGTGSSGNRVYAFHVELSIEGTDYADDADQVFRFESFLPMADFAESMEGNGFAFKGQIVGRVLLNGTVIMEEVS